MDDFERYANQSLEANADFTGVIKAHEFPYAGKLKPATYEFINSGEHGDNISYMIDVLKVIDFKNRNAEIDRSNDMSMMNFLAHINDILPQIFEYFETYDEDEREEIDLDDILSPSDYQEQIAPVILGFLHEKSFIGTYMGMNIFNFLMDNELYYLAAELLELDSNRVMDDDYIDELRSLESTFVMYTNVDTELRLNIILTLANLCEQISEIINGIEGLSKNYFIMYENNEGGIAKSYYQEHVYTEEFLHTLEVFSHDFNKHFIEKAFKNDIKFDFKDVFRTNLIHLDYSEDGDVFYDLSNIEGENVIVDSPEMDEYLNERLNEILAIMSEGIEAKDE